MSKLNVSGFEVDSHTEKSLLEASIADLKQRGGKLQISHCGPERRLCVAVDDYAGIYGKEADYRIAKGY